MAKKRRKPGLTPKRDIRITCEGAALVPLGSLSHFQGQFKTLSKREFEKLRETIETDGFSFPVFAWKNKGKNHIIDGHQRVQALGVMLKDGYSLPGGKLPVAWIEAKTEKEAKRKVLLAASQYGRYDEDSTYQFIEESGLEFAELKNILDLPQLSMGKLEAGWFDDLFPEDADVAPAKPKKPITEFGDRWSLGRHVLVCGDSADAGPYPRSANAMVTDPPYGVSYADKNEFLNAIDKGNKNQKPILGDHESTGDMSILWKTAFSHAYRALKPGGVYYSTGPQGGGLFSALLLALSGSGFLLKHTLTWVKNNHVLGRCDYHYKHEPILYGWKEGAGHTFNGGPGETSVWEIDKPQSSDLHPTMKPVALFARAVKNGTNKDDVVLDPFAGSGTTLIACEELKRRAHLIELDPGYCDVIVERWENYTGKKAKRARA